jgi:hypothetical protein
VSTSALVWVPQATAPPEPVDPRLLRLRQMVLDAVTSANSKRNYAKALDDLFVFAAGRSLTRAQQFPVPMGRMWALAIEAY